MGTIIKTKKDNVNICSLLFQSRQPILLILKRKSNHCNDIKVKLKLSNIRNGQSVDLDALVTSRVCTSIMRVAGQ